MKKTLALFLSFILVWGLTACQQTPDEALIIQKDKDRLAAAAAETAAKEVCVCSPFRTMEVKNLVF